MYNAIAANKRKTWLFTSIFCVVILAIGWFLGHQTGSASQGIILATIIATSMSLVSYFDGDKLALATSGAKQINKDQAPELWRMAENLCITSGVPMPKVHIIEDDAMNAFATGRNPAHASIAVTTGLLRRLEKKELEGVLAHELSHVKNYDILIMTMVIVMVGVITLLADWMLRSTLFGNRDDRENGQAGTILFVIGLVLSLLSPLIAELIKLAVSREREYLADASGALLTRYPEGLASALEKIHAHGRPLARANHATAHLFIAEPFGTKQRLASLFSTHPPVQQRIDRLRSMGI